MKVLNILKKASAVVCAAVLVAVASISTAFAVVPEGVQAAIAEAGTDSATVLGYFVLAAVAVTAIRWIYRQVASR